ncbi:MAG: CBS domain-containing protein [Planctomycetota bacterium]
MFVRDWMSAPAVVVPLVVPVHAAVGFMEQRKIRRLPVVESGRLVGIVTRNDLQAALGRDPARGAALRVAEVMTPDPVTVERDDTLEAAAQLMLRKKISGLPVISGGRVAGILTESDLFRALCRMMGFGERGARITLTVGQGADLLEAIRRRLDGLSLQSLVTVRDRERGVWNVVLRVRGRVAAIGR